MMPTACLITVRQAIPMLSSFMCCAGAVGFTAMADAGARRWCSAAARRARLTTPHAALLERPGGQRLPPSACPEAQGLARLFATHAAIALGHAQERENLNAGLQTRKVIGRAIGILMER
jgi:hypothetical protein